MPRDSLIRQQFLQIHSNKKPALGGEPERRSRDRDGCCVFFRSWFSFGPSLRGLAGRGIWTTHRLKNLDRSDGVTSKEFWDQFPGPPLKNLDRYPSAARPLGRPRLGLRLGRRSGRLADDLVGRRPALGLARGQQPEPGQFLDRRQDRLPAQPGLAGDRPDARDRPSPSRSRSRARSPGRP